MEHLTTSPAVTTIDRDLTELAIADGRITPLGDTILDEAANNVMAEAAQTGDPSTLTQIIEALPTLLPVALRRIIPSASDETAALIVADLTARLRATRA